MAEVPLNFSVDFSEFDAQEAGRVLGTEPRTMRDVAHGDGQALDVNDATLEVYPDAGIARVTTPDARIELFRVPTYTIAGGRVVFEQGEPDDRSRLLVRGDGKVSFYPVLRAADASWTRQTASRRHQDSPAGKVASETTTEPSSSPEPRETVQEVALRGRLGRDPWFSTRDDRPAAGFPLAVNPENGGKATWHDVVTFDDTAKQLRTAFEKRYIDSGKLVDVTGQPVVVEAPKAGGGVKKTREFHATAVTRVQATRPGR
jgi:hypothetical protein